MEKKTKADEPKNAGQPWLKILTWILSILTAFIIMALSPVWSITYFLGVLILVVVIWAFFWQSWKRAGVVTLISLFIVLGATFMFHYFPLLPPEQKSDTVKQKTLTVRDSLMMSQGEVINLKDSLSVVNKKVNDLTSQVANLQAENDSLKKGKPDSAANNVVPQSDEIAKLKSGLDSVKKVLAVKRSSKRAQPKNRICQEKPKTSFSPYEKL